MKIEIEGLPATACFSDYERQKSKRSPILSSSEWPIVNIQVATVWIHTPGEDTLHHSFLIKPVGDGLLFEFGDGIQKGTGIRFPAGGKGFDGLGDSRGGSGVEHGEEIAPQLGEGSAVVAVADERTAGQVGAGQNDLIIGELAGEHGVGGKTQAEIIHDGRDSPQDAESLK